ncbi:unnamed protein product [Phytomonas sp. Hart1]|nr:unnamed protein product [Phytomonas sp. Hart1]|eukprot:CCW70580.1 unnamed protein product [Phytomonas sp. isolate Hart1]
MLLTLGPPRVYGWPINFLNEEFIQQVSVNVFGDILVTASQVKLHFWSNKKEIVYLASFPIPQCSIDNNPVVQVLWHPRHGKRLAVFTTRQLLFYEVDIMIGGDTSLALTSSGNSKETETYSMLCDTSLHAYISKVLYFENGFATSVKLAGLNTFTVCTTLGVVHLIGWDTQKILKTWDIESLQKACSSMACNNSWTLDGSDDALNSSTLNQKNSLLSATTCEYREAGMRQIKAITPPGIAVAVRHKTRKTNSMVKTSLAAEGKLEDIHTEPYDNTNHTIDGVLPTSRAVHSNLILHVAFATSLSIFAFVLSNDCVFLARTYSEADLTNTNIALHGRFHALKSVMMVCINATHSLLAVASRTSEVSCHTVEASSLSFSTTAIWRFKCERFFACPHDVMKSLPVSDLQWSPGMEELLCVGFDRAGIVVLHYSGICVMRSLVTNSTIPGDVIQPFDNKFEELHTLKGFQALSWTHHATRLLVVGSQSKYLSVFDFARALSSVEVGPSLSLCTPLFLLMNDALGIVQFSDADGPKGVKQCVRPPPHYLEGNYPLRYGSMSTKGNWIVCAGCRGCATYSRASQDWFIFEVSNEGEQMSCVGNPVWLDDVLMAMPVRNSLHGLGSYEISVYHPMWLSRKNAIASIQLPCQPLLVSATNSCSGYVCVCVCDAQQTLRVYSGTLFTKVRSFGPIISVDLELIFMTTLTGSLTNPLSMQPVLNDATNLQDSKTNRHEMPVILLQPHKGSALVCLLLSKAAPLNNHPEGCQKDVSVREVLLECHVSRKPPHSRIFRYWVDRFSPLEGLRVVTFEDDGLFYLHFGDLSTPAVFVRLQIAQKGVNLIPLALSPYDGYLLCLSEPCEGSRSVQSLIWRCPSLNLPMLSLRPVVYAHCVLALILHSAIDFQAKGGISLEGTVGDIRGDVADHPFSFTCTEAQFCWLETMRQNGSFVESIEYFFDVILEEGFGVELPGLSRTIAIQAITRLLRSYPEFYEIMAVCLRKIDTEGWDTVLGILGPLLDFCQDCVTKQCYAEALIMVRVMLLNSCWEPSDSPQPTPIDSPCTYTCDAVIKSDSVLTNLTSYPTPNFQRERGGYFQRAFECAVKLFGHALREESLSSARDLVQFVFLLKNKVSLPSPASTDKFQAERSVMADYPSLRFGGITTSFAEKHMEDAEAACMRSYHNLYGEYEAISYFFSDGSSASLEVLEDKQEQRKMEVIFCRCPQFLREVESVAVELLRQGYLLRLYRLFQTFSLSLEHFKEVQLSSFECKRAKLHFEGLASLVSTTAAVDVACVFDSLHIELGLPRSCRPLGDALPANFMLRLDGSNAPSQNQNRSLWTQAQVLLFDDHDRLSTVKMLQKIFYGCANLDLAFSLLLMSKANLLLSLATSAEDSQAFRIQVTLLKKMVSHPIYHGYRPFLHDVILSLPPKVQEVHRT